MTPTTALIAFRFDSSRCLKAHSKIRRIICAWGREWNAKSAAKGARDRESQMARFELNDGDRAMLGEASASAETYFNLGMMYSSGSNVPIDYVMAHKWFNLAAMKGNREAVRLRQEIAGEMSDSDIAAAQ